MLAFSQIYLWSPSWITKIAAIYSAKYRKNADFDPSRSRNPFLILVKLGMVDYVQDPTTHDKFGRGGAT